MATLYTHAAVGLGLGRLLVARPMPWSFWSLAAVLPMLPDLDVFSTAAYGTALGHRGITHSLAFAAVVSIITAAATFRYLRISPWLLSGVLCAILGSHALLDALTKGGADLPLLWPLDVRFGNWGPIPVADLGLELPDPRHSRALRAELLWVWLPMILLVGSVTACRSVHERRRRISA